MFIILNLSLARALRTKPGEARAQASELFTYKTAIVTKLNPTYSFSKFGLLEPCASLLQDLNSALAHSPFKADLVKQAHSSLKAQLKHYLGIFYWLHDVGNLG